MARTGNKPETATTVEQTSKTLKLQKVLSILIVIIGASLLVAGTPETQTIGGPMLGIGLVWFIVTRIRTWWQHG